MSMDLFLVCRETAQQVPLGSYSDNGPSGEHTHGMVLKLFSLAHCGMKLEAFEGGCEDFLIWDMASCVEMYERMTQQKVSDSFLSYAADVCSQAGADYGIWDHLEQLDSLDPDLMRRHRMGPRLRPRTDYLK